MSVSSINDAIKPPADGAFVRTDVRQGWFVITYTVKGRRVEFYHNQDGRQVFRVDYAPRRKVWWNRFVKGWQLFADANSSPYL